jgi:hypothetical protein
MPRTVPAELHRIKVGKVYSTKYTYIPNPELISKVGVRIWCSLRKNEVKLG